MEEHVPLEDGREANHRERVGWEKEPVEADCPIDRGARRSEGEFQKRRHREVRHERTWGSQNAKHLVNVALEAVIRREHVILEEARSK